MRKLAWIAVLMGLVAWAHAAPQVEVLPNGLTVVVEEDHSAPVATVQFFVGTGSVYENEYLGTGISHLLEHVISDGTRTRNVAEIERDRARLGNASNAYTSKSTVGYYVVTSGQQVTEAIDHLADFIFFPTFPPEAVETQKGIITREMARGEDEPGRELYNLFAATMFRVSPEGNRIIGYPDQFDELSRDALVALHQRYYVPRNVVAVAIGDFSAPDVLAHMREVLGPIPPRALRPPVLPTEPPQVAPRRSERRNDQVSRTYFMLGYPSVSLFSEDMYPLDVASYVLSNGDASRLVAKLRDEQGLVDSVTTMSYTPAYDAGFFAVSAVAMPDRAAAAEQAILAELARLQREPVSEAELDRAKRQKEADLLFARVTTQGRAELYGGDLLTTGDIGFSDRYVEKIRQVTAQDIQRVARRYFVPSRYNYAALIPAAVAGGTVEQPAAATAAANSQIHEATLSNGVRLLVQENHAVPVVNVFAAVPGGLRYETESNVGITSLMAGMLVRGTATRSRLQIARALEDVGGSLMPFSGRNSFGVSAQVRKQDLPLALNVASDVLAHPAFPEQELQQQKQLQLAALQTRQDNVDVFAGDLMLKTLFQRYPYRFPPAGTVESVGRLTRQDLLDFHAAMTKGGSTVLAIFGDTTLDDAKRLAEQTFGRLPAGTVAVKPAAVEPPPAEPRQETLTRPQQQAIIVYGFRSGPVDDPNRYARDVMTAVFAGIGYPGGRLHNTLRDAQLVYATYAYETAGPDLGYYTIYAGTAPGQADVVRQQIEKLIRDLQAAPPDAAELALAKNIAIASHAIGLESSGSRAQAVALDVLYGLGSGELFRYAGEIEKVTAEQVQQQARDIMDLSDRVLVVTTPQ